MLAAGARVGQYEVLEPLGAGAMGQVFRARDLKLGRFVALKTLPEQLPRDAERLARFEREARVLASLNHPNIATLHEVADLGDTHVLVLELVEGETLAERIARGALPLGEALPIAAQIAAALEVAHEQGVVHRDLKPANVKLRADGTVKLLDFGLAKVLATHADGSGEAEATVTGIGPSGAGGAVLGTPAYMSPEQARGLPVDKRADVWAFGCVLYEMLTGCRAFTGERATDVLVSVVDREPAFEALPAECPPALKRLLRRCLTKDARHRLRDIGDARLELADAGAGLADAGADLTQYKRRASALAALAVLCIAAVATWLVLELRPSATAAAPRIARFVMAESATNSGGGAAIAISSDGKRIAYVNDRGLMLRSRDRLDATVVAGAAGLAPFFSPDGEWLAFTDWYQLRKVPVAGGRAQTVADVGPSAMGTWSGGDLIVADMNGFLRIPAAGGPSQRIDTDLTPREQPLQPQYLAQRQAVLYTVTPSPSQTPGLAANAPGARIEALDLRTGQRRVVVHGGGRARYLPTGHLVYAAGPTLYAVPFDVDSLAARGEPTAVLTVNGQLEFAVADDGTLVYQAWPVAGTRELVWVDRQGREEPVAAPPMRYTYPRLSPDGQRIGLDLVDNDDRDIWIFDLRRGTLERFTHDPAGNPIVAWSPDGRYLAFGSDRFGVTNLFRQAADGSGEPERLIASADTQMPIAYAPDGRLLFSQAVPGQQRDIYVLSLDAERHSTPLVATAANELMADVSPDGRWVAYDSDESGQFEVYVRGYPNTEEGGRWQVSSGGGRQPLWSHDGRELLYRDFDGALLSVAVTLTPTFAPGPVAKLFDGPAYVGGGARGGGRTYDIAPDDSRFIMLKSRPADATDGSSQLVVVLDWFAELERLAPLRDARPTGSAR
jgi:eukaryotic-like serine/threonine-protein kinase